MSNYISPYQKELNILQSQINDLKKELQIQDYKREILKDDHLLLTNTISNILNILNKWHNQK